MRPLAGEFVPSDEIDEIRWIPASEAGRALQHEHDRRLVREALAGMES